MSSAPAEWPLGERQAKLTFYYNDTADLMEKLRYVADQLDADNKIISEHPPWFAGMWNCCGGSPP